MSAFSSPRHDPHRALWPLDPARRVANVRAVLALAWAVALLIAAGGHTPLTSADLSAAVATLLASYPLIDVTASVINARSDRASRGVLTVNAAISAAAVVAIAVTGLSSDSGSAVASFGAWASISGLIQLGVAIHRRRASNGQLPMIASGGLSTLAGISFIAQSGSGHAHVTNIGGYMVLGALLYLLWAFRERTHRQAARKGS